MFKNCVERFQRGAPFPLLGETVMDIAYPVKRVLERERGPLDRGRELELER